jgi:hypothetical protein
MISFLVLCFGNSDHQQYFEVRSVFHPFEKEGSEIILIGYVTQVHDTLSLLNFLPFSVSSPNFSAESTATSLSSPFTVRRRHVSRGVKRIHGWNKIASDELTIEANEGDMSERY